MRRVIGVLVLAALLAGGQPPSGKAPRSAALAQPASANIPATDRPPLHYITNLRGSTAPRWIGYDLFDVGPTPALIDALPDGVRALVWLGQKCPTPADAVFKARVRALADNPRVFGYYLSDEPHVADCPDGPEALRTRARFIRSVSDGRQRSFVVLSEYRDYRAFRPEVSRVSLIGLNPYPCSVANPDCDFGKIGEKVNAAIDRGIPRRRIVPVYQTFGQEWRDGYYRLPTERQLRRLLARWERLVPDPVFDYSYTWGQQDSVAPALKDSLRLKWVLRRYFHS